MAVVTRPDAEYPRAGKPETPVKTRQRGGGPSMDVPGDGGILKGAQTLPGERTARSAAHHADAMSNIGGSAKAPGGKRVDNK